MPTLGLLRPFEWGIIIAVDSESDDDLPALERGRPFVAGDSSLVVLVRHAQDTAADLATFGPQDQVPPFLVAVRCWVDASPPHSPTFQVLLNLPSGRVTIGDAEQWDTLELPPGAWSVSARTSPSHCPEQVDLWFQSASLPRLTLRAAPSRSARHMLGRN